MTTLSAESMNGKPVYLVPAKSVLNMASGFRHKLLCDGPTFSAGSACGFSCSFCYVPDLMRKSPHLAGIAEAHGDIVIRRDGAIQALRRQLTFADGRRRFVDPADQRVVYMSPLVDVAANPALRDETIEACKTILTLTPWHIRVLSKSTLLPSIARALERHRDRMIYGVSTGTLNDSLAAAFEHNTPLVSKRITSLHQLQDEGFRTFGMICPSLPQDDYDGFAVAMRAAIRAERCEHVWAEILNARGESMTNTISALRGAGFSREADALAHVSSNDAAWETYARSTFLAHAKLYDKGTLRFLQYVRRDSKPWWQAQQAHGAIML